MSALPQRLSLLASILTLTSNANARAYAPSTPNAPVWSESVSSIESWASAKGSWSSVAAYSEDSWSSATASWPDSKPSAGPSFESFSWGYGSSPSSAGAYTSYPHDKYTSSALSSPATSSSSITSPSSVASSLSIASSSSVALSTSSASSGPYPNSSSSMVSTEFPSISSTLTPVSTSYIDPSSSSSLELSSSSIIASYSGSATLSASTISPSSTVTSSVLTTPSSLVASSTTSSLIAVSSPVAASSSTDATSGAKVVSVLSSTLADTTIVASPVESLSATATTATFSGSSTTSPSSTASSTTSFPSGLALAQCIAMADDLLPDWAGADFNFSGNVRTFYVTAEQITWNYAPSGWDNWMGVPLDQSARAYAQGYTSATGSIGGAGGFEWQKAVYKGYTNESFTVETDKPSWLGLNGPIMRAEMGDMIQVVFLNKLTSNYMNVHSMGLGYDKSNEGSVYPNVLGAGANSTVQAGDAVPPGGCFTYKWLAGALNAPPTGFESSLWSYHPYVNMGSDMVTGLVGPVIIYNPGTMATVQAQNREFILLYEGYPETQSFMALENVATYAPSLLSELASAPVPPITITTNQSIWGPQIANFPQAALGAGQGPEFMALNGYVYANMAPFEMCQGDSALWYVYAFGAQSHTFHLHGNNFQVAGEMDTYFRATLSINNGEMRTISMNASRPGLWQFICHVSTHQAWGMVDFYQIYNETECPLTALTAPKNSTIP